MSGQSRRWCGRATAAAGAVLMIGVCLLPTGVCAEEGDNTAVDVSSSDATGDYSGWFGSWARTEVLGGLAVWQLIMMFVFLLAGLALRKTSDHIFEKRLIPLFERSRFSFDNLILKAASRPIGMLIFLGGLAGAAAVLMLPSEPNVRGFVFGTIKVFVAADVLWFLFRMVDVLTEYLAGLAERSESKLDDQLVPLIRKALKVTIGVVVAVWVVQLLGYSAGSLIAGLGIGGLAIALGLQDTLSNFFGSVFIFLDRPFSVGDLVKIGDVEGAVEQVGFRSTRIRTFAKTLVAIPNKTVANATVDNWSKRPLRRVVQTVGVTYETSADQMEQALARIRDILGSDEGVDQEYKVVRFDDFGGSSLNITVLYFTKATDYDGHLATKERVNLATMRALDDLGLSIAFPTQTVYFEGDIAKRLAGGMGTERRS